MKVLRGQDASLESSKVLSRGTRSYLTVLEHPDTRPKKNHENQSRWMDLEVRRAGAHGPQHAGGQILKKIKKNYGNQLKWMDLEVRRAGAPGPQHAGGQILKKIKKNH